MKLILTTSFDQFEPCSDSGFGVDKRGNAIVNLKLDDFELRVDGRAAAAQRSDALGNERSAGDAVR